MWDDLHKKLLQKQLTRREFLQFLGGALVIAIGFGNLITLVKHFTKTAETPEVASTDTDKGFGTRKFGA
jgi:hypothetical protein